jgi:hypothetical protein
MIASQSGMIVSEQERHRHPARLHRDRGDGFTAGRGINSSTVNSIRESSSPRLRKTQLNYSTSNARCPPPRSSTPWPARDMAHIPYVRRIVGENGARRRYPGHFRHRALVMPLVRLAVRAAVTACSPIATSG